MEVLGRTADDSRPTVMVTADNNIEIKVMTVTTMTFCLSRSFGFI